MDNGITKAPVTLASEQSLPNCLAADAINVYWTTTDGNVLSVPTGGGTPIVGAGGSDRTWNRVPSNAMRSRSMRRSRTARYSSSVSSSSVQIGRGVEADAVAISGEDEDEVERALEVAELCEESAVQDEHGHSCADGDRSQRHGEHVRHSVLGRCSVMMTSGERIDDRAPRAKPRGRCSRRDRRGRRAGN